MKNYKLRTRRIRSKIRAVSNRPRLTVIRSNEHIWAQVIDDKAGITIAAMSSKTLAAQNRSSQSETPKMSKTEKAALVGSAIAKAALEKKVTQVVFDRGAFRYHGRIKALAEAARKEGLEF